MLVVLLCFVRLNEQNLFSKVYYMIYPDIQMCHRMARTANHPGKLARCQLLSGM